MSECGDIDYLTDTLEAIQRCLSYPSGMDWDSFVIDFKTQDAVVRNLEIIRGELTARPTWIYFQIFA